MTPERWAQLTTLFDAVVDLPPSERMAALERICPDDRDLREDVVRVIESDAAAASFGESPAYRFIAADSADRRQAASLPSGARLGRYEIVGLVGAGGMGEVYRARDPQLGRDVGIKILPRRGDVTPDQLARFGREARAVAALNHPNIVTVYDVGVDADAPFVVSELLEGETLRARLERGPLPQAEAVAAALQILSGLAAAHDKGIIHRDLKPENLFMTAGGAVKILDFGLARQIVRTGPRRDMTDRGLVMGTAGYMAPEHVRGEDGGARSDLFSFGAVFHEMLTGTRAFDADSIVETMHAVLVTEAAGLDSLAAAPRAVVERCLAKDPAARFASAHEVAAALASLAAVEQPPRRRLSQLARVAFAIVLLIVAGAAAVTLWQRRSATPPAGPAGRQTFTLPDAYELYLKAQQARHSNRWSDARKLFEEALRLDPEFTLARAQLVTILDRLGERGASTAQRSVVVSQLERLPERQRLLAEAVQEYDANPSRALQLLERLIDRYPDEEEAYDAIVHAYTHTRDPAYWGKTLVFMQRWERAIPGPGSGHFHNHYGYAYIEHGLFTEAEREFKAYIRVSPDEANAHDSLAELYLMTGRPALAVEAYDKALHLNPSFGWSHFGRAYALSAQGRYDEAFQAVTTLQQLGPRSAVPPVVVHFLKALMFSRVGREADAAAQLDAARTLGRQQGDPAAAADADLIEATIAVDHGNYSRAVRSADRAVDAGALTGNDIMRARRRALAHAMAGIAEARAGRIASARNRFDQLRVLDAGSDPIQVSWQHAVTAEIALRERRLDEAEREFRAAEYQITSSFAIYPALVALANNLPFRDGLARTALARGDVAKAIAAYRALNQPDITSTWTSLFDPRYMQTVKKLEAGRSVVSASY